MDINLVYEKLMVGADHSLLHVPFMRQLTQQLRAIDVYGVNDLWSDEQVLDAMVMTNEKLRAIPLVGDPDRRTVSKVHAYYSALAQVIEREIELMAVPVVNISHEGFGRALILVGKLVVLNRTLRDVHRFGFVSLEALAEEANKLIVKAVLLVDEHRLVAGL